VHLVGFSYKNISMMFVTMYRNVAEGKTWSDNIRNIAPFLTVSFCYKFECS